jgi:hypothetical protein
MLPEIEPAAPGNELTVTDFELAVPEPQLLVPKTATLPEEALVE